MWGLFFFAFFEKFVVPILTSGGYVGLSIATLLSQNHEVTAVDIIPEKVDMLNNRRSPIQDEYIEKYLTEKQLNLKATLDAKSAYSDADFVVIAAPTNYDSQDVPGIMFFSESKVLISTSMLASMGHWRCLNDIYVLGISSWKTKNKTWNMIKPFAMWEEFKEHEVSEDYFAQLMSFKGHGSSL